MIIDLPLLKKLREHHIRLEEFIVLYAKVGNSGILDVYTPMPISYNTLRRLKYLDSSNNITDLGLETYRNIISSNIDEDTYLDRAFEDWWKEYPANDSIGSFMETRKIRTNRRRAKELYLSLTKSGSISPDLLLSALKKEVAYRIRTSQPNNNALKYMQSPSVWLNNRSYENFLEEEPKTENLVLYGKDIN